MGNMICCATIERLEETHEDPVREKINAVQGIVREISSLTLFPAT